MLTGQRFGRLLVGDRAPNRGKRTAWFCVCDCGETKIVPSGPMVDGRVQSCGCLKIEVSRRNATKLIAEGRGVRSFQYEDSERGPANHVIHVYERNAKTRDLEWALPDEVCRRLFSQPCVYCGVSRSNKGRNSFRYNGIDRVDNTRGYEQENVVPCCKFCNKAKGTMSEVEFKAWISRVYQHSCAGGACEV